jgi:AcrR family transcriptional regulator
MSTVTDMNKTRSYTMGARAQSVEETRQRILRTTFGLASDRKISEISLDDVARGASVSVQTVLRQFGSRADLVDATIEFARAQVIEERRAPVGDLDAAVRIVVDHYELRGDMALLMLTQEDSDPVVRRMTDQGKAMHRAWVTEVFAPHVARDRALVDLLVVATDVYTWKLLRRDAGLSRSRVESRMKALVAAVLATAEPEGGE